MNGDADLWTARNFWTGFLDGNSREFDTQLNLSRKRTIYGRPDKYLIFRHFRLSVGFGTSSLMTPEGHEKLRALGLRSRRADGQRFLALGRLQYPA